MKMVTLTTIYIVMDAMACKVNKTRLIRYINRTKRKEKEIKNRKGK